MGWPHAVSLRAQVSCGPQPTRGYCNPLFQHWNAAKSCWQYLLEGSLPQLKVFTTNTMVRESRVHANTTFAGFTPMLGPGKSLKPWPVCPKLKVVNEYFLHHVILFVTTALFTRREPPLIESFSLPPTQWIGKVASMLTQPLLDLHPCWDQERV